MPLPYPDRMLKDVSCITAELLASMGVKGLLLDIDGTLLRSDELALGEELIAWAEKMKAAGVRLFILSNNKREWRVKQIAESLGLPYSHLSRKPRRAGFLKAAKALSLASHEVCVVGDQVFTDALGAKRCGMKVILVDSLDTYLWYFKPRRFFEKRFLREKQDG